MRYSFTESSDKQVLVVECPTYNIKQSVVLVIRT